MNASITHCIYTSNQTTSFFISELARTHQRFKDVGDRCEARCKICGDSKKSDLKARLNFYKKTNSMYCFNCGFSGSALFYLSKVNNIPINKLRVDAFISSKNDYCKNKYTEQRRNISKEQRNIWTKWNSLSITLPEYAKKFIIERKFNLAKFKSEKFEFRFDTQHNYLAFPWIENNLITYYQLRNIQEDKRQKYLFMKNVSRPDFFGIDQVNRNIPYIFICEGVFDAIFVQNCIAAGSLNIGQNKIDKAKELFPGFEIIIMIDNPKVDTAGSYAMQKLCNRFPTLKFFVFPEKYSKFKDVGAIIQNFSGNQLSTAISEFSDVKFLSKQCKSGISIKAKAYR